jgi:hypothetical protein
MPLDPPGVAETTEVAMKAHVVAGSLVATALLGGATWSAVDAQASPSQHGWTFHLRGRVVSYTAVPDRSDGSAQQPGDQSFFVTALSRNDHRVGEAPHHCVAADPTYSLCTAVARLPRGDISLQTLLPPSGETLRVAVTGGTGVYRGVTGEVDLRATSATTQAWTFRLQR